jgi:hypothetical protein
MASVRPYDDVPASRESPRKRQKLSPPPPSTTPGNPTATTQPSPPVAKPAAAMDEPFVPMVMSGTGFQPDREKQCAIVHFVNTSNPGFTGILKQRYVSHTAFLALDLYPICFLYSDLCLANPIELQWLLTSAIDTPTSSLMRSLWMELLCTSRLINLPSSSLLQM